MKIKVTTTYENVDQEWLDWYCSKLEDGEVMMPETHGISKKLRENGFAKFESKDPSSNTYGTTTYELIRDS